MQSTSIRLVSRRQADVRAWWRHHIGAQAASGLRQAEYCRDHGLDPKYFSLWKGKLARAAQQGDAAGAANDPAAVAGPHAVAGAHAGHRDTHSAG